MRETLRNLLGIGAMAASAAAASPEKVEAQVSGNVEYIQSERSDGSQIKLRGFYGLPQDVRGFTFIELQEGGYFGKTYLDREVSNGIGPRLMAVHGNEPLSETALGINAVVPYTPKNVFATVNVLPLWLGNEGKAVGDKAFVGYFFNVENLPLGLELSGFGDWDVLAEGGAQWDYGEINLKRGIGPFFVGYNPVLFNKGNAVPKLEHRVNIGVNF